MKKAIILQILIALVFASAQLSFAEDKIITLKGQLSSLEIRKSQLESEKFSLVNEGDNLSYKIEDLKRQSESGLGIIGRFRLSQNLRKAQNLSEKIQNIDREIYSLNNQIEQVKSILTNEYETQINLLIQKAGKTNNVNEKKALLGKISEYQSSRNLLKRSEKQKSEPINIAKIDISEHDSPKEIREKADLIIDIANKTNARISSIDLRINKLRDELRTRKKLDEFADEISFFGERVAKGQVVSKATGDQLKEDVEIDAKTKSDNPIILTRQPETLDTSDDKTIKTSETSIKSVMKSNSLSAEYTEVPQSKLVEELKNLEKQKQELKKELTSLTNKADSFRKKADELEKTGKKAVETQNTSDKKQDSKPQGTKNKTEGKP
ncbi:TPA: hypothetical protein ENS27_17505 [bacterium]|nr:hypothetical protein [bacterium]